MLELAELGAMVGDPAARILAIVLAALVSVLGWSTREHSRSRRWNERLVELLLVECEKNREDAAKTRDEIRLLARAVEGLASRVERVEKTEKTKETMPCDLSE